MADKGHKPRRLDFERKGQCKILPSSLTWPLQRDSGELRLVRILPFRKLLAVFLGSQLQALDAWGLESAALASTRILQDFLLALTLVSLQLFKAVIGSSLPESP